MKRNQKLMTMALTLSLLSFSCSRTVSSQNPVTASNRVLLQWNEAAFNAMGGPAYQHSLFASRIYAMVALAMHDAVNAVEGRYEQYAYKQSAVNADTETAAAYAAHTVLTASFPDKKAMLDSVLTASLEYVEDDEKKQNGVSLGKAAGEAMLANRSGDGADINPIVKIEPSVVSGVYNVVPPFDFVFAPHWKTMKLFGLEKFDQFRPAAHPALNSPEYTVAFNEVKEVGRKISNVRTGDQSFYAKFWYEFSETGWNRITRTVIADKNMDLVDGARVLALVNIALADAYTAGWDAKFHYNFWRPYTAIRAAAKDGNSETAAEADWEPCEPTPPVQDYPSTHSALGNAAAKVLIELLGDNTAFTITSFTSNPAGATRSFKSFTQAANENADSRVIAGIHFRFSCEAGQKLGDDIGNYVVHHYLKPRK